MTARLPRLLGFERSWAEAAFDAIYPERSVLAHGIARMQPAAFFDEMLRTAPFEPSIGLRIALWIVGLSPLFVLLRLRGFASLSEDDRRRVLERLLASRIYAVRQLLAGLKAVGSLLYVKSDAIRAQLVTPASPAGLVDPQSLVRVKAADDRGEERHGHAA